jgi:hypothetical protein
VGQYKNRVPFLMKLHEGLPHIPASISAYQMLMEYETRRFEVLGVSSVDTPLEIYRGIVSELHQGIRWVRSGLPVFQLSTDVLSALLLTDSSNVDPEDVRAPFPVFAVTVPSGFWYLDDENGCRSEATTVWVHAYDSIHKTVVPTTAGDRTVLGTLRHPHVKLINLQLCAGGLTLYERREMIGPTTVLRDWLNNDAPDVRRPVLDITETDVERGYRRTIRRLYVNLCLYLSEHRARRVPRKELTKKQRRRSDTQVSPEVYVVGSEIRIQPEIVTAAKAWVSACTKDRGTWRVHKRFCVRGHFRNQVHGPARSLRSRIWIAPFWKGTGPRLGHLYNLSERDL